MEWAAFEHYFGPIGALRDDYHTAQIVATVINTTWRGKDAKPVKVEDVLLRFAEPEPPREQTPAEQVAMATQITAVHRAITQEVTP